MYSFWPTTLQSSTTEPVRGVNLGGWLVAERWMTPSLFKDSAARDEYTLSGQHPERLAAHHRAFITEADFAWLAEHGIRIVRIPVGYWIFGDCPPFVGSIEQLDGAFNWAETHDIQILLDLHGAPGSQNGWDHSGQSGKASWAKSKANVDQTVTCIKQLAERYAGRHALWGVELLNEPSFKLPKRIMKSYYERAYAEVRRACGPDVRVVISDNFRPGRWNRELVAPKYKNVVIDAHKYQAYTPWDKRLTVAGHLKKISGPIAGQLNRMRRTHPVIIGEWSLVLPPQAAAGLSAAQRAALNQAYASAQLLAFSTSLAWFYWTYKTESGGVWSFRDSYDVLRTTSD